VDDAAAVRACRAGSIQAFRYLVERYQREAMGHAVAIVGNRQDAEDVVQEAFLDAFRALERFDERRRFYPWFYTILRNRGLKLAARRSSERAAPAEPAELLMRRSDTSLEDAVALEEAMRQLSPSSRELIMLRELDGLSYKELALRLGVPIGTVMSRLFSARQELRMRLAGRQL
jgi:RNA polymerase sigma-70 factor (ECF subfamily)